jgi:hypothetical protein
MIARMHTQTWSLALQISAAGDHTVTITNSTYTASGRQVPDAVYIRNARDPHDLEAAVIIFREACRRTLADEPPLRLAPR